MLIRIAQSAGFCPGVKKAVDTVRLLAKEKSTGRLFTLGRLIHNSHLVRELEDMGVRVIAKEDLPGLAASCGEKDPVTVVIRTHGVPKELQEQLRELADKTPGFRVIDCTCPFVAKIHRIADERTGEDAALVVFGDPGHPEVQGIVSFAKGDRFVCSDPGKALPDFLRNKPLTVVAQTTGKLSEWKKFKENIKKDCTNPIFFDTICSVTENRQRETALLAAECDLMLVVGGKESSNTRGLLTVAEGAGAAATGVAATRCRSNRCRSNLCRDRAKREGKFSRSACARIPH